MMERSEYVHIVDATTYNRKQIISVPRTGFYLAGFCLSTQFDKLFVGIDYLKFSYIKAHQLLPLRSRKWVLNH